MRHNEYTGDLANLVELAKDVQQILVARTDRSRWPEAQLQARVAAAIYADTAYQAMQAGAVRSVIAASFLRDAKLIRDRMQRRLRRELMGVIADLNQLMSADQLATASCAR